MTLVMLARLPSPQIHLLSVRSGASAGCLGIGAWAADRLPVPGSVCSLPGGESKDSPVGMAWVLTMGTLLPSRGTITGRDRNHELGGTVRCVLGWNVHAPEEEREALDKVPGWRDDLPSLSLSHTPLRLYDRVRPVRCEQGQR